MFMRRNERDDDGMQHHYETCPRCNEVTSTENMVWLDGRKMCRNCLKGRGKPARAGDAVDRGSQVGMNRPRA